MATLAQLMSGASPYPAFGTGARRPAGYDQLTPEQQSAMFKQRQQQAISSMPAGLDPMQREAYAAANHLNWATPGLNLTPEQVNYAEQGNMGARWNNATGQMESTTGQPYMANAGNGAGALPGFMTGGAGTPGYNMSGVGSDPTKGGANGLPFTGHIDQNGATQLGFGVDPNTGLPYGTPPGGSGTGANPRTATPTTLGGTDPNAVGINDPNAPVYAGGSATFNEAGNSTGALPFGAAGGPSGNGSGVGTIDTNGTSFATPGAGSGDDTYAVAKYLDPSMGFQMNQGLRALGSSAAAGGQTFSGNTLKDILGYSQGLASTDYGKAFDRSQQDRAFGYGVSKDNQTIPFQQQMQLAGLGMQGNAINADLSKSLAGLLSANTIAGGQAAGAGTMGGNNAITQMLTQIFGNLQGNSTLQQILARGAGTPAPATTA